MIMIVVALLFAGLSSTVEGLKAPQGFTNVHDECVNGSHYILSESKSKGVFSELMCDFVGSKKARIDSVETFNFLHGKLNLDFQSTRNHRYGSELKIRRV